jgi:hypothetical protein
MSKMRNIKCEQCGYHTLVGGGSTGSVFDLDGKIFCYDCVLNRVLWKAEKAGLVERIQE